MVYAYLQLARDAEARRAIDEAMEVEGISPRFVPRYAMAAMPARSDPDLATRDERSACRPVTS